MDTDPWTAQCRKVHHRGENCFSFRHGKQTSVTRQEEVWTIGEPHSFLLGNVLIFSLALCFQCVLGNLLYFPLICMVGYRPTFS